MVFFVYVKIFMEILLLNIALLSPFVKITKM
jgi:hypothetical protein